MSSKNLVEIVQHDKIVNQDDKDKLLEFGCYHKKRTQNELEYVIRAPGRINLIGDHIDYHGFAVLPMAIENSIWLGCSFREVKDSEAPSQLKIFNERQELFPNFSCDHSFSHGHQLDQTHEWFNYILCGYHGVLVSSLLDVQPNQALSHSKNNLYHDGDHYDIPEHAQTRLSKLLESNLMIRSDLPAASGLSSSSALVCASAIATYLLLYRSKIKSKLELNSQQLADDCPKYEHLIGTHGGGMDQAVIMTAHKGYAKYVEFMPRLSFHDVPLPKSVEWLVSHCGFDYPKAETAGFNSRVFETKLGAALIAKVFDCQYIQLDRTISLGRVKHSLFRDWNINDIISTLREKVFTKEEISLAEICDRLEMTEDQILSEFGVTRNFIRNNYRGKLPLKRRCEHVFEEAERVIQFREICESGSEDLRMLGNLMTESHISLRDKYECSHEALDKLVEVSLDAGALGARLTGAGWGGCIVTLVESDKCDSVLNRLQQVSRFVFRTEPQSGCCIFKMGGL